MSSINEQSEEPPNKRARSSNITIKLQCQITEDEILTRMVLPRNDRNNQFQIDYGLECFNISSLEARISIIYKLIKYYTNGVPLIIIKMLKAANLEGIDLDIIPKEDVEPRIAA